MNHQQTKQKNRDRRRALVHAQTLANLRELRVWNGFVLNRATRRWFQKNLKRYADRPEMWKQR